MIFKNFCPFPVNSLYLSLGNENPSSLWLGTTWQKQENRFLLGAGSSYGLNSTGGNASISLSINNMPSHRHKVDSASASISEHTHYIASSGTSKNALTSTGYLVNYGNSDDWASYILRQISIPPTLGKASNSGGGTTGSFAPYTDYQGNGQSFSIMPPYLAVNIWKRLS